MNLTVSRTQSLMRVVAALAGCRGIAPLNEEGVAAGLCELLGVDFIGLAYWNPQHATYDDASCYGRDAQMSADYQRHYQSLDPVGFGQRWIGEATTHIYESVPLPVLERSEYFNDFLAHYGTTEGINAGVFANGHFFADIRFWRGPSARLLGSDECRLVDLLRPYLFKALWQHRRSRVTLSPESVTAGEARVAALLTNGMSDKEIAARLGISYWTVRTHVAALFGKSGCRNRVRFAAWFRNEVARRQAAPPISSVR